jgi:drug/metabolite transporter (DMT)-like permease
MDNAGYLLGVIIAAGIGVWVATDANKRGMNGVLWGIGVFLLCIVFLPIYLIVRKPEQAQLPMAQAPGTFVPPPMPPGNPQLMTPPAQHPVQPPITPPVQPPVTQPSHQFCANCGSKLAPGVKFCANCGHAA